MFSWWRKFLIIFLIFIFFVAIASVFTHHDGGVLCPVFSSQAAGCLDEGAASLGLHHLSAARDINEVPLSFLFYGLLLIFVALFFFDRFKTKKISSSGGFLAGETTAHYENGLIFLTRFWRWLAIACRLIPDWLNLWRAPFLSPVF